VNSFLLEDFIIVNKIDSELINFPTSTNTNVAVERKKLPFSSTVKIQLFNSVKNEPVIIITHFNSELDLKKIKKLLLLKDNNDLIEQNNDETINITGYKKGFVPPISIFGIRIILDSSLEKKSFLFCQVSEKTFLKVPTQSIIDYNDEVIFEKITI